jgi:hypothetical protein
VRSVLVIEGAFAYSNSCLEVHGTGKVARTPYGGARCYRI